MLAERFPGEDVPTQVRVLGGPNPSNPPAPVRVEIAVPDLDAGPGTRPEVAPTPEDLTIESAPGAAPRCRAHDQLEAERAYGAGFMHEKRGGTGRSMSWRPEQAPVVRYAPGP